MSSEEVAIILAEAGTQPALGPRSLLRHLKSLRGSQVGLRCRKVPKRHNLGTADGRGVGVADRGRDRPVDRRGFGGPVRVESAWVLWRALFGRDGIAVPSS